MESLLSLLRGPLLLSAVFFPLFARYLLLLRFETVVSLGLLGLGLVLTCHDVIQLLEIKVRDFIHRSIDTVVLDDVMKSLLDPQSGMLPCLMAAMLGNATMYALPLSTAQRVRLVQSCLELPDEDIATHILTAPGGIRQLFPQSVRQWLQSSKFGCDLPITQSPVGLQSSSTAGCEDRDGDVSSSSTSSSQAMDHLEMEYSNDARAPTAAALNLTPATHAQRRHTEQRREQTSIPSKHSRTPPSALPPEDPSVVMGTILKELSSSIISRLTQGIPDAWLQGASAAGAMALCLQLRSSPRTRRIILGVLEGTTAIGFASVALGALAALVAKHTVIRANPTAEVRIPTTLLPAGMALVVLKRVKEWVSTHANSRQLQAAIALFLLYYFRRSPLRRAIPRRV